VRLEGGPWLTVASLVLGGREVLVDAAELPADLSVHEARAGITLLHPWANRLSSDEDLPAGAPRDETGLPIHGLPATGEGWVIDGHVAVLHATWPAPHDVRVAFELDDDGLRATTRVEAAEPVPIAFGWHPYLRPAGPRAEWRLALPARRRHELDGRGLPTGQTSALEAEDAPLGDRTLDDAFDEIAPGAVLAAGDLEVVHDAGYPCAQVFAPSVADVVSLEPMTAPVDALRSGAAARATEAEAIFTLRLRR
jgi:galactose mutarotase-like enzyme